MSIPVFKDFDKSVTGIFNDDFDSKYTLKIKTNGPFGASVTTNSTYDIAASKVESKISTKYSHESGFSLDKLEISPKGKITTEISLTKAAPGLKLEFKGDDSEKGDLSLLYNIPKLATITADIDALKLSKVNTSVAVGHGPFSAGANVDLTLAKGSISGTKFGLGFGYTVPKLLFAGLRANSSLSEYSGLFSYILRNDITFAGKVSYTKKTSAITSEIAAVYQYDPNLTLKFKTTSAGVINASVKQDFEKKFSVVGSVEVPSGLNGGFKFGVNAVLG